MLQACHDLPVSSGHLALKNLRLIVFRIGIDGQQKQCLKMWSGIVTNNVNLVKREKLHIAVPLFPGYLCLPVNSLKELQPVWLSLDSSAIDYFKRYVTLNLLLLLRKFCQQLRVSVSLSSAFASLGLSKTNSRFEVIKV